jgi:uracil-DNA glycosylase
LARKILTNYWDKVVGEEFQKDYYLNIRSILKKEYSTYRIYPHMKDIFNALHLTDYNDVKVVIIGQDPYHGPNQAHGLCFSVKPEVAIPPSLRNIYKELNSDIGCNIPNNGYLVKWAKQGVLMINAVLTVRSGQASSHSKIGWQNFTDEIIRKLNEREEPIVFILWGNYARSKKALITNSKHFIIESAHPSPLSASRGFFGSKPFSKTNNFLKSIGRDEIDWQIENI